MFDALFGDNKSTRYAAFLNPQIPDSVMTLVRGQDLSALIRDRRSRRKLRDYLTYRSNWEVDQVLTSADSKYE